MQTHIQRGKSILDHRYRALYGPLQVGIDNDVRVGERHSPGGHVCCQEDAMFHFLHALRQLFPWDASVEFRNE